MEKIFLYHPDEAEFQKIKRVAGGIKIRVQRIDACMLTQPLESIISGNPNGDAAKKHTEPPDESLLLMNGFSGNRMDRLLSALRKAGTQVDYKAIVTPTNRKWNVMRLLLEMRAEKAAYEANKKQFS